MRSFQNYALNPTGQGFTTGTKIIPSLFFFLRKPTDMLILVLCIPQFNCVSIPEFELGLELDSAGESITTNNFFTLALHQVPAPFHCFLRDMLHPIGALMVPGVTSVFYSLFFAFLWGVARAWI